MSLQYCRRQLAGKWHWKVKANIWNVAVLYTKRAEGFLLGRSMIYSVFEYFEELHKKGLHKTRKVFVVPLMDMVNMNSLGRNSHKYIAFKDKY